MRSVSAVIPATDPVQMANFVPETCTSRRACGDSPDHPCSTCAILTGIFSPGGHDDQRLLGGLTGARFAGFRLQGPLKPPRG